VIQWLQGKVHKRIKQTCTATQLLVRKVHQDLSDSHRKALLRAKKSFLLRQPQLNTFWALHAGWFAASANHKQVSSRVTAKHGRCATSPRGRACLFAFTSHM
jgi:hypothetical protein